MEINDLDNAVNEMDVQDRYRVALRRAFKDIIFESKYRTDGLAYSDKYKLRMILEQKHEYDFSSLIERAKVIAQILRYIKIIHEDDPKIMPKVVVVGDENECFVLPVKDIINYIAIDNYQWTLPPSSMYQDKGLMNDLMEDDVVKNLYIYEPKNEFKEIVDKIKQINQGVFVPRTLTVKNIDKVYKYFTDNISLKKAGKKILPNDSVNLFANIMLHPDSVMLNNKTKQLFTGMFKEPLSVSNVNSYISFITEYSRVYTPKQKHIFTAILDRLIEDTTRRMQGEFFTPAIWVDKAHEYISSVYGEDWKEKYIVWDPAWGTGNLTRDYKFKELYVSTLNQSDIDTANQMGYNLEATKFQYDFLNDPYEYLPQGLRTAIECGKKIIVLMNPPYATSNVAGNKGLEKSGTSQTKVNEDMKSENVWGKSAQQLYTQFLYRVNKLGLNVCLFSKPNFITGSSFEKFRKQFFKKYYFEKGFVMDSSEFADVESWPLTFTILSRNQNCESFFEFDVLSYENFQITKSDNKLFYNNDDRPDIQKWLKSIKKNKTQTYWPTKNGFEVSTTKGLKDNMMSNSLGYFYNNSNCVQYNSQGVAIFSTIFGSAHGVEIMEDNIINVFMMMSARQLVKPTWINEKDEYMVPTGNTTIFGLDSIVLSLFSNGSYQTSLRGVEYKNQIFDVKNEFFWMSKEELSIMANSGNYPELYNDVRTDFDRFVYNLLFGEQRFYDQLSEGAKDVLDSASNLVRLSFGMRRNFADDTNHLNSWDAGYAQLKLLWKEYYPEQFKEFRDKYKVLEDKMRPMVYELGFLKK